MGSNVKDKKKKDVEIRSWKNPNTSSATTAFCCSSSGASRKKGGRVVDQMAESEELDAAKALADFAQIAFLESEGVNGEPEMVPPERQVERKWGAKGVRSAKRVKSESPASDLGKNSESSNLRSSDVVQQYHSLSECNKPATRVTDNVVTRTAKIEPDIEILRSRPLSSTSMVFGGGRSRHQLTEAEKEERKMRRILANRESARQTIRRRQLMCEEMMARAKQLESENENMKLERERALREYQLEKDKNEELKAQLAMRKKDEPEEVQEESKAPEEAPPIHVKAETSSEKPALLVYNSPVFTPFGWPSIIQPLNLPHTQPIPLATADPNASTYIPSPSQEQGNPLGANGPRGPFYILPCPWFIPVPEHGNGLFSHPRDSPGSRDKQDGTSADNHNVGSSSKAIEELENNQPITKKFKLDTSNAKPANNLTENSTRPINGENHILAHHSGPKPSITKPTIGESNILSHRSGKILTPKPVSCINPPPITVKSDDGLQQTSNLKDESASSSGHSGTGFSESILAQSVQPNKVDAAEARKRRMELTKLKNLNGRQLHLYC